jgi:hypothetical protein
VVVVRVVVVVVVVVRRGIFKSCCWQHAGRVEASFLLLHCCDQRHSAHLK